MMQLGHEPDKISAKNQKEMSVLMCCCANKHGGEYETAYQTDKMALYNKQKRRAKRAGTR